jgi:hypothetical protein
MLVGLCLGDKKVGGAFNPYGGEGPRKSHIVALLEDPARFQVALRREGCCEDSIWDLDTEIDHADGIEEQVSEDIMQACLQLWYDE